MGTSRSHFGHQRFCWMRVWHSAWSWLKLIVAAESVAGNTRTGMLTRLIFKNPFHVGRAAIVRSSTLGYEIRRAGQTFPASQLHPDYRSFAPGPYPVHRGARATLLRPCLS